MGPIGPHLPMAWYVKKLFFMKKPSYLPMNLLWEEQMCVSSVDECCGGSL